MQVNFTKKVMVELANKDKNAFSCTTPFFRQEQSFQQKKPG